MQPGPGRLFTCGTASVREVGGGALIRHMAFTYLKKTNNKNYQNNEYTGNIHLIMVGNCLFNVYSFSVAFIDKGGIFYAKRYATTI